MTSQEKEATSGRKRRSGVVSMVMTDDPKRFLTVIHEDLEGERSRPTSPSVRSLARTEEKEEKKDRDEEEEEERKPRTTRSYSSCRLFSPTALTLPGGRNLDLSPTRFDFGADGGFGLGFELFPELSEAIRTKIIGNGESADDANDDDNDDDDRVTMRRDGSTVTVGPAGDKPLLWSSGGSGTQEGSSAKVKDYMKMLKAQRARAKPQGGVEVPKSSQLITRVDHSGDAPSRLPAATATPGELGGKDDRKGRGQSQSEQQQAEDKDEVLGKLKETATRLNLPTRRPSYLAWRERYLNPLTASSAAGKVSSGEPSKPPGDTQSKKLDKLSPSDPPKGGRVPGIPLLKRLQPPPSNGRSPPLARPAASSHSSVSQRQPLKALRTEKSHVPSARNPERIVEECTSSTSSSHTKQRTLPNVKNVSSEVHSDTKIYGGPVPAGCSVHRTGKEKTHKPETYTASVTLHLQRGDLQNCFPKRDASSGLDSQSNSSGSRSLLDTTKFCLCASQQVMVVARKNEDDRIDETTTTKSPCEQSASGVHARDSAYNSDDDEDDEDETSHPSSQESSITSSNGLSGTCPEQEIRCRTDSSSREEAEETQKDEPSHESSKDSSQANSDASNGTCPDEEIQCRTDSSSREDDEKTQNEVSQIRMDARENVLPRTLPKPHSSGRVSENLTNERKTGGGCQEETCTKCGRLIQREKAGTGNDQGQSCIPESVETDLAKVENRHFLLSKKDSLTREKRREIDGKLEWIKSELVGLRRMDQSLARQLLNIHHDLCRMRLVFSCQEHRELLEDMTLDLAEVETLKRYLEYPSGALSFNPLKHIGVTKMNIVSRRFSTC